jgi:SMI1 / KNR4 family (SUKH-1)
MDTLKSVFLRKMQEFGGYQGFSEGNPNDLGSPGPPPTPISREDIVALEAKVGVELPDEYREFLMEFGPGMFSKSVGVNPIEIRDGHSSEGFSAFYGWNWTSNIWEEIDCLAGRIPENLIPIAGNGIGDQYCLGVKGPEVGKVFFWNHEDERLATDYWDIFGGHDKPVPRDWFWGNITLVANSIGEFVDRLVS